MHVKRVKLAKQEEPVGGNGVVSIQRATKIEVK